MVSSFEQLLKLQKETAYRKGYVSAHLEQIGCFMDLNKKSSPVKSVNNRKINATKKRARFTWSRSFSVYAP